MLRTYFKGDWGRWWRLGHTQCKTVELTKQVYSQVGCDHPVAVLPCLSAGSWVENHMDDTGVWYEGEDIWVYVVQLSKLTDQKI
jgi:hypothetical protein